LGAVSGFNFVAYLGKNKEQSKTPIQMWTIQTRRGE
jgi:hypothetical protein